MSVLPFPALDRARMYAKSRNLTIQKQLGGGFDGVVLGTKERTAIKSINFPALYEQELAVYLRLKDYGVSNVKGFQVPVLIDHDDELSVIEMSIVMPPFALDFAGARLDRRSPFSSEEIAEWMEEKQEQFESDWPTVKRVMWAFESMGIYLNDVHPGNVRCR